MKRGIVLILAAMLVTPVAAKPVKAPVEHYTVRIVKTFPHDPQAFTEGLFYDHGYLYESTGRNGTSSIRKVDLNSGKVVLSNDIDSTFFGEGIAPWAGRVISLTWRNGTGFVWDAADFRLKSSFRYAGEGWGMTRDNRNLIMSDGTPALKFLNPDTLKVARTVKVTLDGKPLNMINELECVDNHILANIWMTGNLVRIEPRTGKVDAIIDLSALPEVANPSGDPDAVANGIAYDPDEKRLFVTGKLWPHLYQVELVPDAAKR